METKGDRIEHEGSQIIPRDAQQHVPTSTHIVSRLTARIWIFSLDAKEAAIDNVPSTVKSETNIEGIQF